MSERKPSISLYLDSSVKNKILSKDKEIHRHLFKCLIFKNIRNTHHWEIEILSFLDDLRVKTKGSNRFPPSKFYYTYLWEVFSNNDDEIRRTYNSLMRILQQKYTTLFTDVRIVKVSIEEFQEKFANFFQNVSDILSNNSYSDELCFAYLQKEIQIFVGK